MAPTLYAAPPHGPPPPTCRLGAPLRSSERGLGRLDASCGASKPARTRPEHDGFHTRCFLFKLTLLTIRFQPVAAGGVAAAAEEEEDALDVDGATGGGAAAGGGYAAAYVQLSFAAEARCITLHTLHYITSLHYTDNYNYFYCPTAPLHHFTTAVLPYTTLLDDCATTTLPHYHLYY
jgi:hypothetical protein